MRNPVSMGSPVVDYEENVFAQSSTYSAAYSSSPYK